MVVVILYEVEVEADIKILEVEEEDEKKIELRLFRIILLSPFTRILHDERSLESKIPVFYALARPAPVPENKRTSAKKTNNNRGDKTLHIANHHFRRISPHFHLVCWRSETAITVNENGLEIDE